MITTNYVCEKASYSFRKSKTLQRYLCFCESLTTFSLVYIPLKMPHSPVFVNVDSERSENIFTKSTKPLRSLGNGSFFTETFLSIYFYFSLTF